MSTRDEERDRCPVDNLRLAKLYHKAVGDRHFTAYKTPAGNELMRCPVHGVYRRGPDGRLVKVAA